MPNSYFYTVYIIRPSVSSPASQINYNDQITMMLFASFLAVRPPFQSASLSFSTTKNRKCSDVIFPQFQFRPYVTWFVHI